PRSPTMEDFPVDDKQFHIFGPVWMLVIVNPYPAGGEQVVSLPSVTGGKVVPMFTDEHLAERFLGGKGGDGPGVAQPLCVPSAEALREVLHNLTRAGYGLVTFDPPDDKRLRRAAPIDHILAVLDSVEGEP